MKVVFPKFTPLLFLLIITLLIGACGTARRMNTGQKPTASVLPPPTVPDTKINDDTIDGMDLPLSGKELSSLQLIEKGVASWYGSKFHGRLTANGERYDMYGLTAAHRTLPFNTLVLVKNVNNGKSVIVRINDRGPFAKNRIIDLSKKAARHIGLIGSGTAPVKLYVADEKLAESSIENIKIATYTIQLGSYETESQAFEHASKVQGSRVEIAYTNSEKVFRVYYGLYIDKQRAYQIQKKLARKSIEGYVKQVENG